MKSQNMGSKQPITFIDLFAGIGGIRRAFNNVGMECLFSCEWDEYAQKTYQANFNEQPCGDINSVELEEIPSHDILTAGFPCQPFSIAGVSKKNSLGRHHGFLDKTQGTLFFNVARIIEVKRPKAFLLENVKNLKSHDGGNTFRIILETLEDLGYKVFYRILDASSHVPQHRERIFIVGFDSNRYNNLTSADFFQFPVAPIGQQPRLRDILEESVPSKYTLSDHLWQYLQDYAAKHRARGNGFGFGLADPAGIARTLSARYYKDGSEILIPQDGRSPRRLTPRECARLMGFPDDFIIPVSDTRAYKQFGNSVVVPLVQSVAEIICKTIEELESASAVAEHPVERAVGL